LIGRRSAGTSPVGRAGALLLPLAIAACLQVSAASLDPPLPLLDPATGETVRLEPGPAALHVVFFATWCPACIDELDRLANLEARWTDRDYRLVLVAVRTRQEPDRLRRFLDEHQPPGRLLLDGDGRAEQALAPEGMPTHVVFDADGREAARSAALDAVLEGAIDALLTGPGRAAGTAR